MLFNALRDVILMPAFAARRRYAVSQAVYQAYNLVETGLCFCNPDGVIILANSSIRKLCLALTGEELINGQRFWALVSGGFFGSTSNCDPGPEVLSNRMFGVGAPSLNAQRLVGAQRPTFLFDDGTVVSLSCVSFPVRGEEVWQIEATDMTSRYNAGQELERENALLEEANERLRAYDRDVDELVRNEEILNAKARIHDDIGQTLTATKRFLVSNDPGQDYQSLVRSWQANIALLRRQARPEPKADPAASFIDAGRAIGLNVQVSGSLPVNDAAAIRIINAAVREAMVNAVRHGGATELEVVCVTHEDWYDLTVSNNGEPVPEGICVKGGLANLRARVEAAGGTLRIVSAPRVALEVRIIRKDG